MTDETTFAQIQMWSRDGNLDARTSAVFQPNHFVPVLALTKADVPAKKLKNENLQPAKKKPCNRLGHSRLQVFGRPFVA